MKFLLTKQSWPDVWCWWKHHGHLLLVWASVSDWRSPPSLTFSFSPSLSLSPHLPLLSLSLSACFLIGWGNVRNFIYSLSQPPGRPDPPLAVWLPRRAGSPAEGSGALGGRVRGDGALRSLGNSKLLLQLDGGWGGSGAQDAATLTIRNKGGGNSLSLSLEPFLARYQSCLHLTVKLHDGQRTCLGNVNDVIGCDSETCPFKWLHF